MSAAIWFWILYVISIVFGFGWGFANTNDRRWIGGSLIILVLIGLLGWGLYGKPIK